MSRLPGRSGRLRPRPALPLHRRPLLSLTLVATLGGLGGCGGTAGPATAAVLPDPGYADEALNTGVLDGDPDTGCLWLEHPSGGPEQIMLMGDFRVDWAADPPRVEKEDQSFAELGELISVGGGGENRDGVPGCPVSAENGVWLVWVRVPTPPG